MWKSTFGGVSESFYRFSLISRDRGRCLSNEDERTRPLVILVCRTASIGEDLQYDAFLDSIIVERIKNATPCRPHCTCDPVKKVPLAGIEFCSESASLDRPPSRPARSKSFRDWFPSTNWKCWHWTTLDITSHRSSSTFVKPRTVDACALIRMWTETRMSTKQLRAHPSTKIISNEGLSRRDIQLLLSKLVYVCNDSIYVHMKCTLN